MKDARVVSWQGRVALALLVTAATASGCAWDQHTRPARDGEVLVLESMVVRLPAGSGWRVSREFDAGARRFILTRVGDDGVERARIELLEADGAVPIEPREKLRAANVSSMATLIGDPAAEVADLPLVADARFGSAALELALRATESDAHAGILVKRVAWSFQLAFVGAGSPARTCAVSYWERRGRTDAPAPAEESWRALLAAIELRSADPAHVAEAARADGFPKQMESGLARRSLTLPRGAFQWGLWRARWLDHGNFDGSWGLHVGITDRLELSAPGFLKYSFGEREALTRPEYALGIGWTHFEHDPVAGSTWGFGLTAQARKRLAADLSAHTDVLLEWLHESRTARDRGVGQASAGLVWDPHALVSLGLEAGYGTRAFVGDAHRVGWVGGLARPLVTVHVAPIDLGLAAAAVWDGRDVGVLAGFSLRLTL